MVDVPTATPVTKPPELMVATDGVRLCHVAVTQLPAEVNRVVFPTQTVFSPLIDETGNGLAVTVVGVLVFEQVKELIVSYTVTV